MAIQAAKACRGLAWGAGGSGNRVGARSPRPAGSCTSLGLLPASHLGAQQLPVVRRARQEIIAPGKSQAKQQRAERQRPCGHRGVGGPKGVAPARAGPAMCARACANARKGPARAAHRVPCAVAARRARLPAPRPGRTAEGPRAAEMGPRERPAPPSERRAAQWEGQTGVTAGGGGASAHPARVRSVSSRKNRQATAHSAQRARSTCSATARPRRSAVRCPRRGGAAGWRAGATTGAALNQSVRTAPRPSRARRCAAAGTGGASLERSPLNRAGVAHRPGPRSRRRFPARRSAQTVAAAAARGRAWSDDGPATLQAPARQAQLPPPRAEEEWRGDRLPALPLRTLDEL